VCQLCRTSVCLCMRGRPLCWMHSTCGCLEHSLCKKVTTGQAEQRQQRCKGPCILLLARPLPYVVPVLLSLLLTSVRHGVACSSMQLQVRGRLVGCNV
jgi:hypothetical protein